MIALSRGPGWIAVLAAALLALVASTQAGDEAPEQAADKVLAAWKEGDEAALRALAAVDDPDPWLVADALSFRGEHDAAAAFAGAAPRADVEKLPRYVEARRAAAADAEARRDRLAVAAKALAANDVAAALAAVGEGRPEVDDVVSIRIAFTRGVALRSAKRLAESAAAFLDTGRRAAELGWLAQASAAFHQAGMSAAHRSDFPAAITAWETGIGVLEARGSREGVARSLSNLGNVHGSLGNYPKALSCLERALAIAEELGDRAATAGALGNLAVIHRLLGDYPAALACLERSLGICEELGDRPGIAKALGNIGNILTLRGDYLAALSYQEKSLGIEEELGDRSAVARTLANIGTIHHALGDNTRALPCHQRALVAMEEAGDRAGVARSLRNIGFILASLGRYAEALPHYRRALALAEEIGDRAGIAGASGGIGRVYRSLGDYPEALSYHERELALAEEIGDRAGVARATSSIGLVHAFLGDHGEALSCQEKVLGVMEEMDDRAGIAATLGNIGSIHDALGDHAKALTCHERALEISEKLGNLGFAATTLGNIGAIHDVLGDHAKALSCEERALALAEKLGDRGLTAATLMKIGSIQRSVGDYPKALSYEQRALAEAEEIGERETAARALWGLAKTQQALGDPAAALASCRKALVHLGQLASGLAEEEGARAREQFAGLFDEGTKAGLALGDPAAVCYFVESGRAATLLEMLGGRDSLREVTLPEELRAEEARARERESVALARYRAELEKGSRTGALDARQQLDGEREKVAGVIARIQRHAKAGADIAYPDADSLDAIGARVRDGEAMVLYAIFGTQAAAVVITPGAARIVELGEAQTIREACADVVANPDRLGALVVEPLDLPAGARVLISPAGALSYVPFVVLLGGREVAYVPSGTTYGVLRGDAGKRGDAVLALGDPDYGTRREPREITLMRSGRALVPLPGSGDEARAVGTVVLLRADATEAGLHAALASRPRWRALHLACHGLVNPEKPKLSSLALSGGDYLTTLEVFRLRAPADLVVLSACETAQGKVYRAEGVIGFVRGFMFAGAPRVLASLWKVDDAATRALMVKFYELWNPKAGSKGLPTATALKRAMEFVRDHPDHPEWKDPKYWAAWQLWGLPD